MEHDHYESMDSQLNHEKQDRCRTLLMTQIFNLIPSTIFKYIFSY
jgi:hypothetical protein